MSTVDHGPAAREVDGPAAEEGRLERAIGEQVRRIRGRSGATLSEMAALSGISRAMLSKIENAQISCSLTTLSRLATALDVPVTALFRGADGPREAVHTPSGAGARIVARGTRAGHDYTLLGGPNGARSSPSSSTPGPSCSTCSPARWSTATASRTTG